jgi:hypothetical protein
MNMKRLLCLSLLLGCDEVEPACDPATVQHSSLHVVVAEQFTKAGDAGVVVQQPPCGDDGLKAGEELDVHIGGPPWTLLVGPESCGVGSCATDYFGASYRGPQQEVPLSELGTPLCQGIVTVERLGPTCQRDVRLSLLRLSSSAALLDDDDPRAFALVRSQQLVELAPAGCADRNDVATWCADSFYVQLSQP